MYNKAFALSQLGGSLARTNLPVKPSHWYTICRTTRGETMKLTALIEREGDGYVSLCPELDIANQGAIVEAARDNLREALELFFESASRTRSQSW